MGQSTDELDPYRVPGLKKQAPYWHPYVTMAKQRWLGREILEVVSTEFRDRSMEYYRYALESGVTTLNGKIALPGTIIKNGDRMENVSHRHEPPVTSKPVKVLLHDVEREFIVVDKPGSIPVHASGRFYRNTLIQILENEFGYEKAYPVNRLDRLTSGLMILPLSYECARTISEEFMAGTVRKEYVARVKGNFPSEEITCEAPMLTVDRQMGLNIVHPDGKPAKTVFNLIRYDADTNSSVVRCHPFTGRSHQLRVHLQWFGYPIANDPIYSEKKIWGENLGKGGVDVVPIAADAPRQAPQAPAHLMTGGPSPESLAGPSSVFGEGASTLGPEEKLLPRETGHDIGMGSPVPLSAEAIGVIANLRNMKDEDEDWSRWRDVVFRAKGKLTPKTMEAIHPPLPPPNQKQRGGESTNISRKQRLRLEREKDPEWVKMNKRARKVKQKEILAALKNKSVKEQEEEVLDDVTNTSLVAAVSEEFVEVDGLLGIDDSLYSKEEQASLQNMPDLTPAAEPVISVPLYLSSESTPNPPQVTTEEAMSILSISSQLSRPAELNIGSSPLPSLPEATTSDVVIDDEKAQALIDEGAFCPECYLPLHPDPKPEALYIFLHALKYTTTLGCFETEMPDWSKPGWTWE